MSTWRFGGGFGATIVVLTLVMAVGQTSPSSAQQLKPEELAAQVLNAANKAFEDKQFPVALERYREYLQKFGGMKDVHWARLGLGLALLEGPTPNYQQSIDTLNQVVGVADFPERPTAFYYLGLGYRSLGHDSLAQAVAKPNEAPQHRANAVNHFANAGKAFTEAMNLYAARVKTPPAADAKELPADLEWSARARCDLAETWLRQDKLKEALDTAAPLVADATLAKSRFRPTALYYHGQAAFLLKDYVTAVRSLSQLAPFSDRTFGAHAQYLLARTHHLHDDRAEATKLYDDVLKAYETQKAAATQTLKDAAFAQANPEERLRLENLLKAAPEYVQRASLYSGVLLFEELKFGEANARFTQFQTLYPQSAWLNEAKLRQGLCQVQLKQHGEALKTLPPLFPVPVLGEHALLWAARAQIGAADPNQPQPYAQSLATAMDWLKQASDRANQLVSQSPEAKQRRAEALVELADTQLLAKQYPAAAGTFQTVLQENHVPERAEEVLQRLVTAQHLAGQFDPSDQLAEQFKTRFPKSTLLPAVLFRSAENAYARAAAIEPNNPYSKNPDLVKWFGEAANRYKAVIDQFPEYPYVAHAKFRQALAKYRLGDYPAAIALLAAIPAADQSNLLATTPYYHGDLLLRTMPTETSDALSAARQVQQLAETTKKLDPFVASQPAGPQTPDALIKLGYAYRHMAAQLANPQERNEALNRARQNYEKVVTQFAQHPLQPLAVYERARCLVDQGDVNGAMNELGRFKADPLKASPVAPLAYLRLAALLRAQNRTPEAVDLLKQSRDQYEAAIAADPLRAAWAPLLTYHHGLALQTAGKLPEARAVYESLVQKYGASREMPEAAWRAGQCRVGEALPILNTARGTLARADAKPEERTAATAQLADAVKRLTETAQYFRAQADALAKTAAGSDTHQRLLYEAAWCYQHLSDVEIAAARQKAADEAAKKLAEELAKRPPNLPALPVRVVPEIAITAIPLQPSEQLARDHYKLIVAANATAPLALLARHELAESHARRNEHDPAIALLQETIDQEPPQEIEERVRLRLGATLLAKNNLPGALEQFAVVVANPQSPLAPEARYRAGECQMLQKNWAKAIELWVPFRDQQPLQGIAGLSDRALLRLSHAFAQAGQWEPSRQAAEIMLQRFPQSSWRFDARYAMGFALQSQKQFDPAANVYAQLISETAAEVAAKGQYQLALCRLEQNRLPEAANALLVVPFTYDYPEWSALALLEASRVFKQMQQTEQATRLLRRVLKDYPDTDWSKTAQQRLLEMQTGAAK